MFLIKTRYIYIVLSTYEKAPLKTQQILNSLTFYSRLFVVLVNFGCLFGWKIDFSLNLWTGQFSIVTSLCICVFLYNLFTMCFHFKSAN